MKRGKKILSIFQINLLVLSMFAFCFILNLGDVGAANNLDSNNQQNPPPPTAVNPTSFPEGVIKYNGVTYTQIIPEKNIAPWGTEWSFYGIDKNGNKIDLTEKLIADGWANKNGEIYETKNYFNMFNVRAEGFASAGLNGLKWAGAVVGVLGIITQLLPEGTSNWASSATVALGVGSFAYGYLTEWEYTKGLGEGANLGISIAAAAIVFYFMYEEIETEMVTFTCVPWDAPVGGMYCEKCNEQSLPCSEYQCRSLGQACELINPETDESKCVWVNKNDVSFPVITPWDYALSEGYTYSPDNTINPPDKGVYILNGGDNECVGAFEPLSFGIILDEPAKCKIDYLRKNTFDEMSYYFGGSSLLRYNHTQVMSLPGSNSDENITLRNDGNYELYVRCQDANGNYNTADFVIKYCVDEGPDTTAPLIVTTNLLNGAPVKYNQDSVDLEVYINEPAECKWDHSDQQYEDMGETMSCSSSISEINAQSLYKCKTTLTGVKNEQENDFYFRCKDQPTKSEGDRITNAESYKFTLIGTQPLVIDEVGPNETVRDSTENVKVTLTAETSAGYSEGFSTCYYSDTGEDDEYIKFFNTDSYTHSQDLYLPEGDYEYYIKCVDLGGNSDEKTTYFDVESDSSAPLIVRTFHEDSYLKLITDEEAECVYDTVNCNYLFDDGISIVSTDGLNHFIDWNTETSLYVKCKDEYGNQPAPNECNIVVRPITRYF